MPDSDDESQSEASDGSDDYTSDSGHEEEDTQHVRKQRLLTLLEEMENIIKKM
jgi:hypothetical protein